MASGDPQVPTSGIPPGPAGFDQVGNGYLTQIVVPTLFGEVYELNTNDGSNAFGNTPLFEFSSDYHPIGATPAVYRDASSTRLGIIVDTKLNGWKIAFEALAIGCVRHQQRAVF